MHPYFVKSFKMAPNSKYSPSKFNAQFKQRFETEHSRRAEKAAPLLHQTEASCDEVYDEV